MILILVLVLVLVLVLALLLHQFIAGIDVILLGREVPGGSDQALLERIHRRLPVFLGYGHIAQIEVIIRGKCLLRCAFLYAVQHFPGILHVFFPVQGIGQVIDGRHRSGVLHQSLPIAQVGLGKVPFAELAVPPAKVSLLRKSA